MTRLPSDRPNGNDRENLGRINRDARIVLEWSEAAPTARTTNVDSRSRASGLAVRPWTVIASGVLAGTIDVIVAAAINQVSVVTVLQAIASGLVGRAAYAGGWSTAALGLGLQWAMSIVIAAVFWLGAGSINHIRKRTTLWGAGYGVLVYVVMTRIVMPLSAAYPKANLAPRAVALDLIAMMLFGVVIAGTPRLLAADDDRSSPLLFKGPRTKATGDI